MASASSAGPKAPSRVSARYCTEQHSRGARELEPSEMSWFLAYPSGTMQPSSLFKRPMGSDVPRQRGGSYHPFLLVKLKTTV